MKLFRPVDTDSQPQCSFPHRHRARRTGKARRADGPLLVGRHPPERRALAGAGRGAVSLQSSPDKCRKRSLPGSASAKGRQGHQRAQRRPGRDLTAPELGSSCAGVSGSTGCGRCLSRNLITRATPSPSRTATRIQANIPNPITAVMLMSTSSCTAWNDDTAIWRIHAPPLGGMSVRRRAAAVDATLRSRSPADMRDW